MKRPGVRLSGGTHGGRTVAVPPGARPTEGRVREALFSIWGSRLDGCRFLELYAGSGAVGLEAAGRGAFEVLCLDASPRAVQTLEANRDALKEKAVTVRRANLPAALHRLAEEDLLFLVQSALETAPE